MSGNRRWTPFPAIVLLVRSVIVMSSKLRLLTAIDEIPAVDIPAALVELERASAELRNRQLEALRSALGNGKQAADPKLPRLLKAKELQERWGVSRQWVSAHAEKLGKVELSRGAVRYDEESAIRYMESKRVASRA